jgi:hypothetical protein
VGPERHHQLDLLILTEDRPMNLRLDERSPQRMPARSFARIHTGAGCGIAVHPAHSGQDTTFFMASVATRDPHGDLDPVTT